MSSPDLNPQPISVLTPLLGHSRTAVRKRTISTIAQFVPVSSQSLFDDLLKNVILPGLNGESTSSVGIEEQRTIILLIAAVTRHSPGRVTGALDSILPGILDAAAKDDDELREYALQALEVSVLRCPTEITPFLGQVVQTGTRLIKYDPVSAYSRVRAYIVLTTVELCRGR